MQEAEQIITSERLTWATKARPEEAGGGKEAAGAGAGAGAAGQPAPDGGSADLYA